MKVFQMREIAAAVAHAAEGGQALHLHSFVTDKAPAVFRAAVEGGREIAHLFDLDVKRLTSTASALGVRRLVIERRGTAAYRPLRWTFGEGSPHG